MCHLYWNLPAVFGLYCSTVCSPCSALTPVNHFFSFSRKKKTQVNGENAHKHSWGHFVLNIKYWRSYFRTENVWTNTKQFTACWALFLTQQQHMNSSCNPIIYPVNNVKGINVQFQENVAWKHPPFLLGWKLLITPNIHSTRLALSNWAVCHTVIISRALTCWWMHQKI